MPDPRVLERISAWEAGGLIDAATAARLRDHEAVVVEPARPAAGVLSAFGPTPTVAEAFGYLGGGFILAAWYTLVGTQAGVFASGIPAWAMATGLVAAVTIGLGLAIRSRGPRQGRATGVLFAVGTTNVGLAVFDVADTALGGDWPEIGVIGTASAVLAAVVLRRLHPALLTQATLIGSILLFAAPVTDLVALGDDWGGMLSDLATWAAAAVVLGVVALVESRSTGADAERRAGLSRFSAGMTAVVATAGILMSRVGGAWVGGSGMLEAWHAESATALVSLAILALAIRRGATAYLYPAALGIVIALTHLNSWYVADQVGVGVALLVEGIVLLLGGLGAQRLRRQMVAREAGSEAPAA